MSKGISQRNAGNRKPEFDLPMVGAAAHELKSPLVLIRQLAQSLDDGAQLSPSEIEQIAMRIRLTSERALRLATDITKAERLEDALFELEPINPVNMCEDVVDELTPLFQARGSAIQLRHRRRLPAVVANRDLLRRVLINFADNALEYGVKGEPVNLTARSSRDGGYVRIAVRDYGPSVSTDVWRSIRDATRYPLSVSRRPNSSGLGLYLAQQFAENMNASIGVTRHRDGASFYIDLVGSNQLSLL